MKKLMIIVLLASVAVLSGPVRARCQGVMVPPEQRARMHNETPHDAYLPGPAQGILTLKAPSYRSTGFTMVQVNVDNNGNNIPGDAANEPSIAIDPQDPNRMAIGWRQFDNVQSDFRQAGYGYSTDGGLSWTFPGVINGGIFRSDPVLDSDSSGGFYYNSLTSNSGLYTCRVFRSSDGGSSWDEGVEAHGGDKQWMTIDRTAGIGSGNIYSSWTSYYSSCQPGFFTRSTDGGNFYEACVEVPANPYWGTMTVGNNGELYVAGAGPGDGAVVVRSNTAQDPSTPVSWTTANYVNLDAYLLTGLAVNPVGLTGQVYIGVDRSSGPGRDNVYVLVSAFRLTVVDSADVMFAKSTDGGVTWSDPIRVNDDESNQNYQWFGTMSVAPNGRIDAVWLDTRDGGPGSVMSSLYYSYSLDQGETWSANERLTDAFNPRIGWPQQQKMGDYFDMESDDTGASLAWANTFNGEQDVYFSRIIPDITAINDPVDPRNYTLTVSPNPFNEETTIRYRIPAEVKVRVSVYDIYGREVTTLADGVRSAGTYSARLSAGDLTAGYYLCRLQAGSIVKTLPMVRVR